MSDDKPPEKPTLEFAKPPDWAIALTEKVVNGFAHVERRLDALEGNLDIQGGTVTDMMKRVTSLEERLGKTEERQQTNSLRAKSASEIDLKHDAAIANVIERQDRVEAKVDRVEAKVGDIHGAVMGVVTNPKVRAFAKTIFTLAMAYAAARGIKVLP